MASKKTCSFCLQTPPPDRRLVAGPGVYICAACIDSSHALIKDIDHRIAGHPSIRPWDIMTDHDVLETLPAIAAVKTQVDSELHTWVTRARERGLSWSKIGTALNITRQTAWERFSSTAPVD